MSALLVSGLATDLAEKPMDEMIVSQPVKNLPEKPSNVLVDTEPAIDWTEKYQPLSFDDLILPNSTKNFLYKWKNSGKYPHLLFHGRPGTGKTAAAAFLSGNGKGQVVWINCSVKSVVERDIRHSKIYGTHENKGIRQFIVIDEADLLRDVMQHLIHHCMDSHTAMNTFILTCTKVSNIDRRLRSRCYAVDFDYLLNEEIHAELLKHLRFICDSESVYGIDNNFLSRIVRRWFPDIRAMIKQLQAET